MPQNDADSSSNYLTRRRFGRFIWITAGLLFVGGQLWWLVKLMFTTSGPDEAKSPVVAGPVEQFPPGSVTPFYQEEFLLVHDANGFLALGLRCTHQGCPVHFLPDRDMFFCACHGAQFSKTGAVLAGPAPRPLVRLATTVRDGQVVVDPARRL